MPADPPAPHGAPSPGSGGAATRLARAASHLLVGVALVAAAAGVRLGLARSAVFDDEQAIFYSAAADLVSGRAIPVLGPALTGGPARHPGAGFYYLLAAGQLLSRTPEAGVVEVALLGALTIGLFWDALRRAFGGFAALVPTVLMVFSPWSALYCVGVTNSNVVGLFVALALWAAVRVRAKPESRWIALLIFACGIMPQFSMSAPPTWIGFVLLVWPLRRRLNRRFLVVGVAITAACYLPYLVSELRTGFGNLRAFGQHAHSRWGFPRVVGYAFQFLTLDTTYFEHTGYWGGYDEVASLLDFFRGTPVRPFHPLRLAGNVASLALAFLAVFVSWRDRARLGDFGRALLAVLALTMALIAATGKPMFAHYVQPALPFLFVLFVPLALRAQASWRRQAALLAVVAVVAAGGADASFGIARRLLGKSSLVVRRAVVEQVLADAAAETWPSDAVVEVRQTFPHETDAYAALMTTVYGRHLVVVSRPDPRERASYVVDDGSAPPAGALSKTVLGGGVLALYRLPP